MEEKTKIDKDYIEAFNQGYTLSKELNLKPDLLEGLSAGKNRIQAMKDGMEQYQKDIELEKSKSKSKGIIPPFDLDRMNCNIMNLDIDNKSKDQDMDLDMEH